MGGAVCVSRSAVSASLSAITANRSTSWARSPCPAALRLGFDADFFAAGFLAADFVGAGLLILFMENPRYALIVSVPGASPSHPLTDVRGPSSQYLSGLTTESG